MLESHVIQSKRFTNVGDGKPSVIVSPDNAWVTLDEKRSVRTAPEFVTSASFV